MLGLEHESLAGKSADPKRLNRRLEKVVALAAVPDLERRGGGYSAASSCGKTAHDSAERSPCAAWRLAAAMAGP